MVATAASKRRWVARIGIHDARRKLGLGCACAPLPLGKMENLRSVFTTTKGPVHISGTFDFRLADEGGPLVNTVVAEEAFLTDVMLFPVLGGPAVTPTHDPDDPSDDGRWYVPEADHPERRAGSVSHK